MDNKILEYQQIDMELIKLEKDINENTHKKNVNLLVAYVKDAQAKTMALEEEAGLFLNQIKEVENDINNFTLKIEKISEIGNEDELLSKMSELNNLIGSLSACQKRLAGLNENVTKKLKEFEETKQKVITARNKHKESKELYDKYLKTIEPQKNKIEKQLSTLEPTIDKTILSKYKVKREDKLTPVFVSLNGDCCGLCRMELPKSNLEKLKQNGYIECEQCHRFIYVK